MKVMILEKNEWKYECTTLVIKFNLAVLSPVNVMAVISDQFPACKRYHTKFTFQYMAVYSRVIFLYLLQKRLFIKKLIIIIEQWSGIWAVYNRDGYYTTLKYCHNF